MIERFVPSVFQFAPLSAIFWVVELVMLATVVIPIWRFYSFGWNIRKQDFTNRLLNKDIDVYLRRFWQNTVQSRPGDLNDKFSAVYNIMSGQRLYIIPAVLYTFALGLFGGLALSTGIRHGYEAYIQLYQHFQNVEGSLFPGTIIHLSLADINRAFMPLPSMVLSPAALSAVAGAYLNTAQVIIRGYKGRTLLSTDLLWSTFRIVIAIPLGLAVGVMGSAQLIPFVAFALGAFPIDTINKLLRRLLARALNDPRSAGADDNLLVMLGVTPEISAQLNEEGIFAPQQLVDTDPVSLSVRTGLPFDFIINLIAQSLVWSYLGATAGKLGPYGYGDARMIRKLVGGLNANDADALATLTALATALAMDENVLKSVFEAIAEDEYTGFLEEISKGAKNAALLLNATIAAPNSTP